jgi:hypothetical protein
MSETRNRKLRTIGAVTLAAMLAMASTPALASCAWYAFWCSDVEPEMESADSLIARREALAALDDDEKSVVRAYIADFRSVYDDETYLNSTLDDMG